MSKQREPRSQKSELEPELKLRIAAPDPAPVPVRENFKKNSKNHQQIFMSTPLPNRVCKLPQTEFY